MLRADALAGPPGALEEKRGSGSRGVVWSARPGLPRKMPLGERGGRSTAGRSGPPDGVAGDRGGGVAEESVCMMVCASVVEECRIILGKQCYLVRRMKFNEAAPRLLEFAENAAPHK